MDAGRELDALVAEKVMGWKRVTDGELYGDRFDEVYPTAARAGFYRNRLCTYWVNSTLNTTAPAEDLDDPDLPPRFAPSTSIAAAWEVVEKLVWERRIGISLSAMPALSGWEATLYRCDREGDWMATGDDIVSANTAPHAICLAALRAVGVEVR